MRFRPANIRLINRRSNLPRLLLALLPEKGNCNYKNNPAESAELTRSLHIRAMHSSRSGRIRALITGPCVEPAIDASKSGLLQP
jgi:hypothetical protein